MSYPAGKIVPHQISAIRGVVKMLGFDDAISLAKKVLGERATYLVDTADLNADDAIKILNWARLQVAPAKEVMGPWALTNKVIELEARLDCLERAHGKI